MSEHTNDPTVVNVDTDLARSKTRNFVRRHKTKLTVAALTTLSATSFILGRRSTRVVESVEIDVHRPDESSTD